MNYSQQKKLIKFIFLSLIFAMLTACSSDNAPQPSKVSGGSDKIKKEQEVGSIDNKLEVPQPSGGPERILEKRDAKVFKAVEPLMEDPNEIVVPPEEAGGKGITRREREEMAKEGMPKNLKKEIASFTIGKDGKGLTWEELERIERESQINFRPENEIASFTIDESGKGLTWKELEKLSQAEPPITPDMESSHTDEFGNRLTYRELERLGSSDNPSETRR